MKLGQLSLSLYQKLAGAVASGSTLLNDIVSYWALDEQTGTRNDSVGSNHLTASVSSPTAVNRGPVGTVASFVAANSESLSTSSDDFQKASSDWTVAGWFWATGGAGGYEDLWVPTAGGLGLRVFLDSTAVAPLVRIYSSATQDVTPAAAPVEAWHFLVIKHITATGKRYYSIDGADFTEFTPANPTNRSSVFRIGGGDNAFATIKAAWTGWWTSGLSQANVSSLFNSGLGLDYDGVVAAGLDTNLVEFWNLDEVSGNRTGEKSATVLTDNNTVGSVHTGPLARVANFTIANSEYLNVADPGYYGTVAFAGWFWVRTSTDYRMLVAKQGASLEYVMYIDSNGALNFQAGVDSGSSATVANGTLPDQQWAFVAGGYDAATKKAWTSVNGEAKVFGTAAAGAGVLDNTTVDLSVGRRTSDGYYWDGYMSRLGWWSSTPSDPNLVTLFNGGNGLDYAGVVAAGLDTNLVEYWNLDEASGNRTGSKAATVLTDNATVTSTINTPPALDGAAASFVGASSQQLTSSAVLPMAGDFSVSAWIKLASSPAVEIAVSMEGASANTTLFSIWAYSDYNRISGRVTDGTTYTDLRDAVSGPVLDTAWHHVLLTREGNTATFYQDGVQQATTVLATLPNGAAPNFKIGTRAGADHFYDGQIDEVAIWDRVLTAAEITELFATGVGKFYPFA